MTLSLIAAGVVLGAFLLYLLVVRLLVRQREVCPSCGEQTLRLVQFIRATVIIDGRRAPDAWRYLLCESCGSRYKQHIGREMEVPFDEEWEHYCSNV
jgi:hypothetical protein